MYERIVVALDGSELAEQILPHVATLAEKFGSTLTLVEAIMPFAQIAALVEPSTGTAALDPTVIEETVEAEEHDATAYLEHVANSLRQRGFTVRTEHPEAAPDQGVIECAKRVNADLIALTTHGRGGLERLVFGSVADSVLRKAPCPVLLVRVHDAS
jgi:nucleotide-binding universal stress UspA family protein